MTSLLDHPSILFIVVVVLLWLASGGGALFRTVSSIGDIADQDHFNLILGATLTLLALIIGFTFSMAVNRYDQRKSYEEQEANAIGTEYLRLDVLPDPDVDKAHALMRAYIRQRIVFYTSRDTEVLRECQAKTAHLQSDLWDSVRPWAGTQPSGISALVLAGMNDVLNSEGYADAIWRNRVPGAAWALMILIAVFSNFLVGCRSESKRSGLLLVLPLVISISLFLIAEIDSPRSGVIRIHAHNLEMVANMLSTR